MDLFQTGEHAERLLENAKIWGVELEPRFRVLAVTFEPDHISDDVLSTDSQSDRRMQLACFPVSTILGSLRQTNPDGVTLLKFTEQQLVDVVAAFNGAKLDGPVFKQPEPRPGTWGPEFSLEGRSTAPDGVSNTITLSLTQDDLEFNLFARFDELRLLDVNGEHVATV